MIAAVIVVIFVLLIARFVYVWRFGGLTILEGIAADVDREAMIDGPVCTECGAGPDQLMDCKVSTNVCMVCGHIMPAEGVPDCPDDLLGAP